MEENTSKVYVGPAASLLREPMFAVDGAAPGTSLFVINLCASIAPIAVAGKTIPGLESYRLYQVARNEDGRTRHRLRLGFFTSEEDADGVLASVRNSYPTAFTTCLSDDDRKFARGFLPEAAPAAPVRRGPVGVESLPAPTVSPVKAPQPAAAAPQSRPAAAASAPSSPKTEESAIIEMTWQPDIASSAATPATAKGRIAASLDAAVDMELSWEPPALRTPANEGKKSSPGAAGFPAQTLPAGFTTEPVIKSKPQAAPAAVKAPASTVTKPAAAIELTLAAEAAPPQQAITTAGASDQPFHVGKGVEIPAMSLSLEAQAPKIAAQANPAPAATVVKAPPAAARIPAKPPVAAPAIAAATVKEPGRLPSAAPIGTRPTMASLVTGTALPAGAPNRLPPSAVMNRPAPELDSTQTIRALTSAELNDDSQEKWFAIQLAVSEQPVNLDAMPHLDIFEAYRLYSVANAGSGKILHSLRIGFFREQVSAEAVSGYLKTFFPSPSVLRISTAEQTRFKDAPAPKAVVAKSDAKVIELNQARDRSTRPNIPTVTMEVNAPSPGIDPSATGTFRPGATGTFKTSASGSYKVNATGSHKALQPAAKSAGVATKRSAVSGKTSSTGKHKALQKKSLSEQLLEEARNVVLSESAIRKLPKNDSLLSRLVGKLTK